MNEPRESRMPVLFLGHGSPLNVIADNAWTRAFRAIGRDLPQPKAVLAISAHWWTAGTLLTGNANPRTIHDFNGFPSELYEIEYPARGQPDLAQRVQSLLSSRAPSTPALSTDWGLDHGTWSVLKHLLPGADVPVVQLSLDGGLSPAQHYELARGLHQLRGEGVLVLGSGNLTHNLRDALARGSAGDTETPDWARQFDAEVAVAVRQQDTKGLIQAWPEGRNARRAHPHPDHWFPLLYAYAATDEHDEVSFPVEGFDLGSISMRAVRWG
jgi:4,5-DOPA dioxygenase extradiol